MPDVCSWFVITATTLVQPVVLKLPMEVDAAAPTIVLNAVIVNADPVSQTRLPRNCPPADVLLNVT